MLRLAPGQTASLTLTFDRPHDASVEGLLLLCGRGRIEFDVGEPVR